MLIGRESQWHQTSASYNHSIRDLSSETTDKAQAAALEAQKTETAGLNNNMEQERHFFQELTEKQLEEMKIQEELELQQLLLQQAKEDEAMEMTVGPWA